MSVYRSAFRRSVIRILYLFCITSFLVSCQFYGGNLPVAETSDIPEQQPQTPDYLKAEVTFEATLPAKLLKDENLYLEILDEVTGLALNAARVQMVSKDQLTFVVKLPVIVGSVLKYSFVRDK